MQHSRQACLTWLRGIERRGPSVRRVRGGAVGLRLGEEQPLILGSGVGFTDHLSRRGSDRIRYGKASDHASDFALARRRI